MKRSGPPKRHTPLKAKKPIRKKNERRIRERRAEAYGLKADWIVTLRCLVCVALGMKQWEKTVPAHAAKTRGAGGKAESLVPFCARHERIWHNMGRDTFDRLHGVNVKSEAAHYERVWQAMNREAA